MSKTQHFFRRATSTILAALVLLTLVCAVPVFTAQATGANSTSTGTTSMIEYMPTSASVPVGGTFSITVAVKDPANCTFQWYFEGAKLDQKTAQKLEVAAATLADAGNYYVKVSNGSTEEISSVCTVTVNETSTEGAGSLYVTGYTVLNAAGNEVQKVSPGEKCQIVVSLKDGRFSSIPTEKDAYGNIVNIKLTSTSSFASPSLGDIKQTTPTIAGGELSYAVIFNDITYLGGENTLSFDVSYIKEQVALQTISQGISQCQTDSEQANSAKPMVMVKDSSYGGTNISAGQSFTLTITAYNTSKTAAISDVKTTLTLPTSLTLAAGSNTVLTDSVGPNGSYTTTFTLQAQSSAETGIANLTLDFQYYITGTDQQLSSNQMITVPIVQPDRFSFTSVDVPDEAYVGEESTITLNYVNKGKGILYNLGSEIVADGGTATAIDPYLGNLNSGTEGSADFAVTADQEGTVSGTLTIIYEDINGVEQRQTKEFSFMVSEMPSYEDPMGGMDIPAIDDGMPQQGMPVWGWALIGVGVVAAVVVAIVVIRKKKAKRRAKLLAEDDDDEDF